MYLNEGEKSGLEINSEENVKREKVPIQCDSNHTQQTNRYI